MKHMPTPYLGSMRRNDNMHSVSSDPSQYRFVLSASKSSPKFLPFASMTQHPLHLIQIGGHSMQRKLFYLCVQVLFQSSMSLAPELYNSPTSPSRSISHRSDLEKQKSLFHHFTFSS